MKKNIEFSVVEYNFKIFIKLRTSFYLRNINIFETYKLVLQNQTM